MVTSGDTDSQTGDSDEDSRSYKNVNLKFESLFSTPTNNSTPKPKIFKYFQDGSEMLIFPLSIYKDNQKTPYPIAIGQVSSAIVSRDIVTYQYSIKNAKAKIIIFLPKVAEVAKNKNHLSSNLTAFINNNNDLSQDIKDFFKTTEIQTYSVNPQKQLQNQSKYKNVISKLLGKIRAELEKELLTTIQDEADKEGNEIWLIRDGSIKYDIDNLEIFPANTLWVSKRWEMPDDNIIYTLEDLRWTPIRKATHAIKRKTYNIYRWYIRPRKQFDKRVFDSNIIMCEIRKETDKIIETEINELCQSLINHETYPTCFGQDYRWERHLYGVHIAEKVCKSILHSKTVISNLPLYHEE